MKLCIRFLSMYFLSNTCMYTCLHACAYIVEEPEGMHRESKRPKRHWQSPRIYLLQHLPHFPPGEIASALCSELWGSTLQHTCSEMRCAVKPCKEIEDQKQTYIPLQCNETAWSETPHWQGVMLQGSRKGTLFRYAVLGMTTCLHASMPIPFFWSSVTLIWTQCHFSGTPIIGTQVIVDATLWGNYAICALVEACRIRVRCCICSCAAVPM